MSSDDILHSLIEASRPSVLEETSPTSAAELVAKYKAQGNKPDRKQRPESTNQIARSPNSLSDEQVRQPSYLTKQKIEDQATLMALGNATGSPKQKDLLEIELTEWCRLLIDRLQLSKMPPETPELLGRAVQRYLTRELARQRGKYK